MLVVIVVFTFCMVICVGIFTNSSQKNKDAAILSSAIRQVETYVSEIKANKELPEVSYDADGYTISIEKDGEDYIVSATKDDGESIIQVTVGVIQ